MISFMAGSPMRTRFYWTVSTTRAREVEILVVREAASGE